MVASDLNGLGGYRTLEYEGQVPIKPYNCCFSCCFQASICGRMDKTLDWGTHMAAVLIVFITISWHAKRGIILCNALNDAVSSQRFLCGLYLVITRAQGNPPV